MAASRTALALIVASMIAACGAAGAPSVSPDPTPTDVPTVGPTSTGSSSPAGTDAPLSPIPVATLAPSPNPTSDTALPKPSGVKFEESRVGDDPPSTEITQTVRWDEPRSEGVEIRVYGVTECIARPANPSPGTSGPCLVERTPLPESVRVLLATAPASDGIASWTWTGTFDCEVGLAFDPRGPAYHSVVLAAYGASDRSIFAIAEPGEWYQPGLDEVIC